MVASPALSDTALESREPLYARASGSGPAADCLNHCRFGVSPRSPRALDTTCASPCGNMTTSPADSCAAGPPGIAAHALPRATTWYSITCSTLRIKSGATSLDDGASAAHGPEALM